MKFLAELTEQVVYITEGEGSEKKHYIHGLFLEFDSPNKNKRIYRSELHDPTVHTYIKEKVETGRGYGECDHPESPTINLKNVSHRITEMHKEGTNWHGKAIITETPCGQIVKGLLASGGVIGVSSRGMGSLEDIGNGILEVKKDYRLMTAADIVSDPSAHNAFVKGIMENVEYFYDDKLGWITEELHNKMKKMSVKEIEEKKIKIFENFLEKIRNI
jgi:hypothetical protein